MYNATVILNFNVPVYVLPKELHATETTEGMELGEINEELALSKADFYTSTQPYLVSSPEHIRSMQRMIAEGHILLK